jgi:acyl-CoA synthetase (AMP-forming)/AMP-acid ligase II
MTAGLFGQHLQGLRETFSQLQYLIVGGDVVDAAAVREVLKSAPPRHLLNGYGPTECTTFSATYEIGALEESAGSVPIGRPISNTQMYLLDRWRKPVPLGAVGEIYIGGAGVARGYLNRPELTAERFVSDPFSEEADARLYRTGDLGRYFEDGNIEFLGRNDEQVKIRGFRIELGEIEARLREHPLVREAAVLAREDEPGEKRLVAYIVTTGGEEPHAGERPGAERDPAATERFEPDERHQGPAGGERPADEAARLAAHLREHLERCLPHYMVPAAFVRLEHLPLTPNGKVDRKDLPAPESDAYARGAYEPPQGEVEELLAGVWQELLGVERVGRRDNFFELGGHSLLALRLITRTEVELDCQIEVSKIFESPTLSSFAKSVLIASIEQEFDSHDIQELIDRARKS